MAVQFTSKSISRTSEYRAFPQDIVINPKLNGRHDLPDIEPLIQDILVNGQHTPVVIRNDGGKAVLCAGFSRYRAVSEINRRKLMDTPLQLRCTYTQANEHEGFLAAISENRVRNSTTELDDAHNIKRLMKVYAMTEEQVAGVYFPGARDEKLKEGLKWVKKRAALVNLSPEAEKAWRDGRLKGSAAAAIAKLSQEQQAKAVRENGTGRIKVPRNGNGNGAGRVTLRHSLKAAVESGRMTVNGKEMDVPDEVVDWLAMLLGGAR
ncbi:MAG TPA: ParB N-terminal domain-containing protein [Candidatus Acidoferrales bacterium]|nr:ParB N-terminal domain-containing protein [Candidatus Acidoferrales bacterium]